MTNNYEIRGNTAVIFLKKKDGTVHETIIDADDLEKAKSLSGTWYACLDKRNPYVIGGPITKRDKNNRVYKTTYISLHRYLYDHIPDGMVIDHINHETFDNRRSVNLRIVTHKENVNNTKKRFLESKNTA